MSTAEPGAAGADAEPLARLTVSLPGQLLAELDAMTLDRHYESRSRAVAELVRHELSEHDARLTGSVVAGTITLVYRADSGRIRNALAQTQLGYIHEVISSQHVFLEQDHSLEVLLVQGLAERVRQLCDDLRRVRGVEQVKLATTSALLPPLHAA